MAEKHELALQTSKKELALSDHLMYVTFPTVGSLKFLMSIVGHVVVSVKAALEALLEYERLNRRVEPFPHDFKTEIDLFRESVMQRYGFDISFFHLLKKLRQIEKCSRDAFIQFRRNNKYFFTTENYEAESIDADTVKKYLKFAKSFISKVEDIVSSPKEEKADEQD